jgi:glycerate 2-kinase
MNILIATDKFKGSLTAKEVSAAIESGLRKAGITAQIHSIPLADGGEGTLTAISENKLFQKVNTVVPNPIGKPISCFYLYDAASKSAFIELSAASGLTLLAPEERNCLKTNTLGTGMQIKHAIDAGARNIMLGIGGSATNDAGTGILQALGFQFLDIAGKAIYVNGENLSRVEEIVFPQHDNSLQEIEFNILCDVSNPLYGEEGAAFVYAPQKGANEITVRMLDEGLRHFAKISARCLGKDFSLEAGTGAAGGVGFGMRAFLNASLSSGIGIIMQMLDFDIYAKQADVIISGEGKIDEQTLSGKVVSGVYAKAKELDKKFILVAGRISFDGKKYWPHVNAFSLMDIAGSEKEAMQNASTLLSTLAQVNIAPLLKTMYYDRD